MRRESAEEATSRYDKRCEVIDLDAIVARLDLA
jgi:hypothetical protein